MSKAAREYRCRKCQRHHFSRDPEYSQHLSYAEGGVKFHDHTWQKDSEGGSKCWCGAYKSNQ